jgi:hypothetical protein
VNGHTSKIIINCTGETMTSNIVKNLAAITVAGTLLSFIIASTAVGVAVILNVTGVQATTQGKVNSVQR